MAKRKRIRAEAHRLRNDITTGLSPDIVFVHILPRLPVKSLLRFTCVSKQWHLFLKTPMFAKMHRHQCRHVITNKMAVVSATTNLFHTIDCERPKEGFSAGRPFPFKVEPFQDIRILTSVHGLVCIGITNFRCETGDWVKYSDLILWNPATGDYKTLSKPLATNHTYCYTTHESIFGLYHSSWDDDYKLLGVARHANVFIYSLKCDLWRMVESDFHFSSSSFYEPSVSLNENLYFLKYRYDIRNGYSIMRFNTKTETLKSIAISFLQYQKVTSLRFTVLRDGCIHLWVNIKNSLTLCSENELWRMDGDGNWTKVVNFGPLFCIIGYHHGLHLMKNGNMLIYGDHDLYELDMMTRSKVLWSYTNDKMLVWPGGKYIETLVSPNQYMK
ncbi:hypothetical protein L1887_39265 [Cichorium endivia]|nr:hypothetical protein L1887_39265 [Cichorium endivia]